jgi:CNT family concentrative nucleoside transporter
MTESELMTVMTSGMAHISGGIMAAYIAFGIEPKHLLTAVIMTAPGTLMLSKMFVPETAVPETMGSVRLESKTTDVNVIDAAGRGTGEGLHLAMNVVAMLISFIALIALVNAVLGWVGTIPPCTRCSARPTRQRGIALSLQLIFGWCSPLAVARRGLEGCGGCRQPAGRRMVLNEFIAFAQLGPMKATLDPRSFTVATFALWFRQLRVDQDSDRRDWRARASGVTTSRGWDSAVLAGTLAGFCRRASPMLL